MNKDAKIYVAGHRGLVGSALVRGLKNNGFSNIIQRTSKELDLRNQAAVQEFFNEEKPDYVFLAAAKVGGILANNIYRGQFIYDNLMIQNNIIHNSYVNGAKKLLFLGSTCIYPKLSNQPMAEDELLTGPLEYTNEPYAIAKIAGIKLCESYNLQYGTDFISVMPTNLYGPNDNFELEKSHVLPAMIRKCHLAKALKEEAWDVIKADFNERPVEDYHEEASPDQLSAILKRFGIEQADDGEVTLSLWGSGEPMREFLWSEDMAEACIFLMENVKFEDLTEDLNGEVRNTHLNIGTGKEISIKDLAATVASIVGFDGKLAFDKTKPDGTMRKLTNVKKLNDLGWNYKVEIETGIERTYDWYTKKV